MGIRTGADRTTLCIALRGAAADWVSGEGETMRLAGLDRWAVDEEEAFACWQIPMEREVGQFEAYLTLRATDWDGQGHTVWRLVWQVAVVHPLELLTRVRQVTLAHLNEASMATTAIDDVLNSLYAVDPAEVLSWMKHSLVELGVPLTLHERL